MSVKSLEQHYNNVVAQYQEMLNDIKDMEKELAEGLVSPDFIDNLKANIAPIKQNYEWWSYVMFLLHEPQRKEKKEKYRKIMKKFMNKLDPGEDPEKILRANKGNLEVLKQGVNVMIDEEADEDYK